MFVPRVNACVIAMFLAASHAVAQEAVDMRVLVHRVQPSLLQVLPSTATSETGEESPETSDSAPSNRSGSHAFQPVPSGDVPAALGWVFRFQGDPNQPPIPQLNSRWMDSLGMSQWNGAVTGERTAFAVGSDLAVAANVVEDEVKLRDDEGTEWTGKVIARDQVTGLAAIRVIDADLQPLEVGVESAAAGTPVLVAAWGSDAPLFTSTMIASRPRSDRWQWGLTQSLGDRALSPEFSGAPVIDDEGSIVGVIVSAGGEARVVPVPQIARLIEVAGGESKVTLQRGRLGIHLNENEGMVAVGQVTEGSPAADADFQPGDVIVEMDGRRCQTAADVMAAVGSLRAGDEVNVIVKRGDESIAQTVELAAATEVPVPADMMGLSITPIQGDAFEFSRGQPLPPGLQGIHESDANDVEIELFQQEPKVIDLDVARRGLEETIKNLEAEKQAQNQIIEQLNARIAELEMRSQAQLEKSRSDENERLEKVIEQIREQFRQTSDADESSEERP